MHQLEPLYICVMLNGYPQVHTNFECKDEHKSTGALTSVTYKYGSWMKASHVDIQKLVQENSTQVILVRDKKNPQTPGVIESLQPHKQSLQIPNL